MPTKLSISAARTQMSASFRAVVQKAAGNSILTTRERDTLESSWAKGVIPKKTMSVAKAMSSYVEPKIEKALYAVSADKKNITAADAEKLFVTDLRASAESLFGSSSKIEKLKSSLGELDIQQLTEYGRNIGLDTYKAQSFSAVMSEIIGQDYDPSYGWDEVKGTKALADFAAEIRGVGDEVKTQMEEDDPTSYAVGPDDVKARYDQVAADALKAFKPTSDFKSIRSLSHGIQEDGDTEYKILIAQKKDNTWVGITYTDWPF